MGFISWLIEPFVNKKEINVSEEIIEEPIETQEPQELKVNKEQPAKITSFRPQNLGEYIGQKRAKKILTSYIKSFKERQRVFPHILVYGKPGTGKTTLIKLLANELDVPFVEILTSSIDEFWILESKIKNNSGSIIFLDEIHALNRNTAEQLHPIMEDFTSNGEPIPQFTLAGATTELGEILKNRRPFYDRFKIIIQLEDYTKSDIRKIIKQYKEKVFPNDIIKKKDYYLLSLNARNIPRNAIRLLEATIFLGDIKQALYNFGIIYNGFTFDDLKSLTYIGKTDKGVGLQSIGSFLGTSTENYLYQIEPYLLQNELIIRTPRGRKITEQGKAMIDLLENCLQKME